MIWREHRQTAAVPSPQTAKPHFRRPVRHHSIHPDSATPSPLAPSSRREQNHSATVHPFRRSPLAPARMEAALKASIAFPHLPAPKTLGAVGLVAPPPHGARILSRRRRWSNPARFCMCRAISGTQRSGRTRGRSYRRSWMGGIASSSWPPAAASPSGRVGPPRLFFFGVLL